MSIRQQVDDAKFLAANGRNTGALTVLMLAVAASSRRLFPRPTPSIDNPGKEMGDAEAFKLFLGGRIRKLLFGDYSAPETGPSGLLLDFRGKQHSIEHILYKYYRCGLVHEAELPSDVEFREHDGHDGVIRIEMSAHNRMVLDAGWITVLINAVVHAQINGPEFGIEHYRMVPQTGTEAELAAEICARYGTSFGRYEILKEVVRQISPPKVNDSSDRTINEHFKELIELGRLNAGSLTGLRSHDLIDGHDRLHRDGISIVREISSKFLWLRIA